MRKLAIFIGLDTDAELSAELTAVQHDTFTERLARSVVSGKCPLDVLVVRKRFCQRLRLCPGGTAPAGANSS